MMSSLLTSITPIRLQTAGGGQDARLLNDPAQTGEMQRSAITSDRTDREEQVQALQQHKTGSSEEPSPRIPELAPVISRLLAFCEGVDHRVIGITSASRGSGVSLLAGELARGYADLGRSACLIDASRLEQSVSQRSEPGTPPLDLKPLSQQYCDGYQKINLHDLPAGASFSTAQFRESVKPLSSDAGFVIVDLAPVCEPDGTVRGSTTNIGAACDVVFLVCLSGVVKSDEFCQCLMQCRAGRMKMGGIVLNDWKLTVSRLIPDV